MFFQDLLDDLRHGNFLEHAAGATVAQQRKGRLDAELVLGKAAVGGQRMRCP